MKAVFLAKPNNGVLDYGSDTNKFRLAEDMKLHPKAWYRTERIVAERSGSQNRYYWAYLNIIEHETGNLADDINEYAKRRFLQPKFIKVKGEEIKIPRSTRALNKIQFGEYLDKICAWSGVALPNPQDAGYLPK